MQLKFVDMFAGIGGFHLAMKSHGCVCVAACEINKQARLTYKCNFNIPDDLFYDDINDIEPSSIPDHHILCAGFPCQPFSISGKQEGLEDNRSNVLYSLFKIIREKKPQAVLLENVKHLRFINEGRVFKLVIDTLKQLGYYVSANLCNAKHFGVPQNRERWIIVGLKSGVYTPSIPFHKSSTIKDILEEENNNFVYLEESSFTRIKNPRIQVSGLIFCGYRNKRPRSVGVRAGTKHLSRVHKQPNRIYHVDGIHPTIPSQESSGRFWIMLDNGKVRKLTILECFRLMGFPDEFIKPVSRGHLYHQIGNSVCIPMIKHIAGDIIKSIHEYCIKEKHERESAIQYSAII